MKKRVVALASLGICLSLMLTPAATAFAAGGDTKTSFEVANEVYVGNSYRVDSGPVPNERGRCTDSYSKGWCVSHGFANNRPVPHAVKLNARERRCYEDLLAAGSTSVIIGLVKAGPGGGLIAAAGAAYSLYRCLY